MLFTPGVEYPMCLFTPQVSLVVVVPFQCQEPIVLVEIIIFFKNSLAALHF